MPTATATSRVMMSGASTVTKRTSTLTSCEFCRATMTTRATRIATIQARQLTGFFSWGPVSAS
jgi:hypothetical protein